MSDLAVFVGQRLIDSLNGFRGATGGHNFGAFLQSATKHSDQTERTALFVVGYLEHFARQVISRKEPI